MESSHGGGIGRHLERTRDAVHRWLQYEQPLKQTSGIGDDLLLSLATEDERQIAPGLQPEVLKRLRESRRFNIPVFPGSVNDWPWISKQELNVAIDVEADYAALQAANLRLIAEQQQGKPDAV